MSSATSSAPLFSRAQRRCHLLLLLYLPTPALTLEKLCQLNGVDAVVARQDIEDVGDEIQRYHQLELHQMVDGSFRIHGTELDRRLCLLHWLRRGLRLSEGFVCEHFAAPLRQRLKVMKIEKALYDEINLQALIQHCSLKLSRDFSARDRLFLQIFMKYGLMQRQPALFNERQRAWLEQKFEREAAMDVILHWQKRCHLAPHISEADFWTLLFSLIHAPGPDTLHHPGNQRLMEATEQLVSAFEQLAQTRFGEPQELTWQLYTHLAQALDRCHFGIGIDNSVALDVTKLYPRLLRTTQQALVDFEARYDLKLSPEEVSLIAVIFGAWLMQESALQEKQVLLLTGDNARLEQQIEQQIREISLLPINIKYQDRADFQRDGAPRDIALVISPYATPLPLYSPPLIHAELPLSEHQQQRIRALLET
ncbi:stationary phase inducible protein CsiE [Candidatus Pantoea deserta]|uniref:Stationary phase inducible protein CsiE n=1 Tax=Candidatus Pantoea deserta TaxID=1869313 RepID=A0A3N4P4U9_9GAMM|nr:stationary phase inducible protein CsiE [Pantoea deserta]RPE02298.1 stationary phase inducible protein CsiE [Pantoea deserta]